MPPHPVNPPTMGFRSKSNRAAKHPEEHLEILICTCSGSSALQVVAVLLVLQRFRAFVVVEV